MKKSILSFLFLTLLIVNSYAQDKKVAVVTFYAVKQMGLTNSSQNAVTPAIARLSEDPKFDLKLLLKNFHDQFFENCAKSFPFQFLPEDQVIHNDTYKDFIPEDAGFNDILKGNAYIPVNGYKVILPLKGNANEKSLLGMFDRCDGVMKVYINFDMESRGFGGMALVKVNAYANIILFNRNGKKVFSIKEKAMSKISGAQIAGIPFLTPEKILPLCESASDELMIALQNDLPKMVRKADRKL
ncbi:hypothetical protein [Mucilaginibacter sp. OK098]|uniref:hypothetical protein n=1 Tax=Mucilaginibacter sp. OK098 TaxID=1855297 RepID=UPI00091C89E2|nr:hypothetical protein [Mucilaginibacter sp. OK098]SHN11945.1 hypothetical protein SAMN05216524_105366 [Mucilaginibacter sp. OK098]